MKKFIIIGNMNAITYKETFPLIKENKMWLGATYFNGGAAYFYGDASLYDESKVVDKKHYYVENGFLFWRVNGVRWFTNIEHSKRNTPLDLYKKYNPEEYPKYDNYNAIEVSKICEIPMDYDGVMGVPISFLDKYCPTQFEIIWRGGDIDWAENECDFYTPPTKDDAFRYKKQDSTWRIQNPYLIDLKGNTKVVYQRMFIKKL